MKKHLNIEIFGIVQGVNFRENFKHQALLRDIKGFVLNTEQGSVYAELESEEETLFDFLTWLQRPAFPVRVTGLNLKWVDELKNFKSFEITRKGNYFFDRAKGVMNLGVKLMIQPREEVKVPNHIVIIPDGNRRWARSRGWKAFIGHEKGISYSRIEAMFDVAKEMGVKYFSMWGFSTENWDRSDEELNFLWNLFRENIRQWRVNFVAKGIKFTHLGRKDRLPKDIIETMASLEKDTANLSEFNFQLCLDYGGRDDIVRAVNKMIKNGLKEIDSDLLREYLDTGKNIPDPDLIIRTSGELRTSGIMAYQGVYAELYFTNKHFPDFNADDLRLAILDYSGRTRRFGGTAEEDLKGIDQSKLKVTDEALDLMKSS